MMIKVVLVDDHPIVLAGMKALLSEAPDIALVGIATDGETAITAIDAYEPDIAVLDISLPDINGLELARRVSVSHPQIKVLTLTVHEDSTYVQPLLKMGVRGYLLKRSAPEELLRAIRAIAEGGIYLDPAVAENAIASVKAGDSSTTDPVESILSTRESAVLRLTARGFSNKEIAYELSVSIKSVETYKSRACDKLNLRSRVQIVRFGASQGWLEDL
jgi:DNA-binding NarL/FixJ family response regulator